MKIPHTFRTLLFAGLATVAQACSLGYYLTPHITPVRRWHEDTEYHINDTIEGKHFHFYETDRNKVNILEVTYTSKITFKDRDDDLKVDEVCFSIPYIKCYAKEDHSSFSDFWLNEAQEAFSRDLEIIKRYKEEK